MFVKSALLFCLHMKIPSLPRLHVFGAGLLVGLLFVSSARAADPAELFEKLSPSVWVVAASDKNGITLGSGSAVVIGAERMITNCHVLKKAASLLVKRDNTGHAARLEFADIERDLCTLRVKNLSAPAVKIAALSSVKVGQKVIVIGAPRGLELTLSDGLVSALRKDKDDAIELVQISAPISPGSSGGGLFNMNGELLGIPALSLKDAQNLNFAIPAEWIKDISSRSEVAEAKKKEEQDKVVPLRKSTSTGVEAQRLMGAELLAVIKKAMGLGANDSNYTEGSAVINVSNVASRSIVLGPSKWSGNARFVLHPDSNELCITAAFAPPPERGLGSKSYAKESSDWRFFVQCYWLHEFAPDKFALREKDASANAFVIDIK